MEGFTVGGFSAMTMKKMNTSLGQNGYAADTDAGGVLANITPGFRKAIGDTFMGLVGNFGGDVSLAASATVNVAARTAMVG